MDNDPARVLGVVLGDGGARELVIRHVGCGMWEGNGRWKRRKERREKSDKKIEGRADIKGTSYLYQGSRREKPRDKAQRMRVAANGLS